MEPPLETRKIAATQSDFREIIGYPPFGPAKY